ncbi:hypothetical protein GL218_07383 [Daldinia childiae]|uniref:uncharacterized protein n=1 Tax=Daldinia childiae TaxID=326645 RepID=UPI001445DFA3|nr:uncharacterized protein GL218_07383 [Daldinia childiae]KAF3054844.1 hypothetical protein GL218_07383 [Daldinia childiae]
MESTDIFFPQFLPYSFPYYSYIIEWKNQAFNNFVASVQPPLDAQFKEIQEVWERSSTCALLKQKLTFQKGFRKVNKVLCFALGDMVPTFRYGRYGTLYQARGAKPDIMRCSMSQHAVALTIGAAFRSTTAANVEILAHNPDYSPASKALLKSLGISVVGEHGAGGFSEIVDDSVVFFYYPNFPLSEIIADIARPAMIIRSDRTYVLDNIDRGIRCFPYPANAETPRVREMWKDYTEYDFEIMDRDRHALTGLKSFKIHIRNDITGGPCNSERKEKN